MATYQRLIDKSFNHLIGKIVEVYMDDMMVKSPNFMQHSINVTDVFVALRRFNLRLNPKKCVFRVDGSKFLGFMLPERGTETNLEKCEMIIDMRSPKNIKDIQCLVGRLTTISRIFLRLTDTIRPMIRLLKKSKKFAWGEECQNMFE